MELLMKLLETADVFIHNLRPGAANALGLTPELLRARWPKLIYADIGAFGHLGPLRSQPGYELLMQAFGGVMSITGEADGAPVRTGPSVNDLGTGMWAAIGILGALVRRATTGEGCLLQTSLFETSLCWTGIPVANYLASGTPPARMGSGHPSVVPYGSFPTATGPLIVAAGNDRLFARLGKALGHSSWATDERFSTNDARVRHRAELEELIASALSERSRDHWIERFEADGIPCAPILNIPEVLAHEQTKALGMLQAVPESDEIRLMGLPICIDGERPVPRRPHLKLGQHTDEIRDELQS